MYHRSTAAVLGVAFSLIVATSVSALGYNGGAITGTVGQFGGPPDPEVVCRYDSAGRLSTMTVRPLTLYGSRNGLTWVGYQIQIREATTSQAGRLVYKSPIARQLASKTVASDFATRLYTVTESLEGDRAYYVRPVMFFYTPGSRTSVEGKGVLLYDRYLQKMGDQSFWSNACTFDFGLTWKGE